MSEPLTLLPGERIEEPTSGPGLWLPTRLLRTVWPPNDGLMPGNAYFDGIVASVATEGIREALTINLEWTVIDGHHRLAAARLLGIDRVRVRVWTGSEFVS